MIQNKLFNYDEEILEISAFSCDPEWKDKLASRLMELSLQGWFYEAYNFTKNDYAAGYTIDIRLIRFRNGPNVTNIDADLIERIISI